MENLLNIIGYIVLVGVILIPTLFILGADSEDISVEERWCGVFTYWGFLVFVYFMYKLMN